MKFKMAPNSLFAILLRSPWWISFLIAAVVSMICAALLPKNLVVFGVMGTLPFLVTGFVALKRQWNAPTAAQVEAELAAQKARRVLEAEAAKDIQRLRRGVIARRQVQQVKEVRAFVFVCVTAMKYTLCSCLCHAWHGGREWRDVVLCCVALCGDHGWNSL